MAKGIKIKNSDGSFSPAFIISQINDTDKGANTTYSSEKIEEKLLNLNKLSTNPMFIFSHTLPDDADKNKTYFIPDNNIVPDFSKYIDGTFSDEVDGEVITYKTGIITKGRTDIEKTYDYILGLFEKEGRGSIYDSFYGNGVVTARYTYFTYTNGDSEWKRLSVEGKTTFNDDNGVTLLNLPRNIYYNQDITKFKKVCIYCNKRIDAQYGFGWDVSYNTTFDSYGLSLDATQPVKVYRTYIYQNNSWTNIGISSISELLNASLTEYTKTADLPVKDVQVNNKTVIDRSTKVAKISVPTKVSQLTNDSKFISQNIQIGGDEPTDKNILLWYDENDSGFVVQYPDGENTEF